jgi:very-short-patch-repair endonuclease
MHRVDWYIDEFRLIIELHGKQHYELVNFGNKSFMDAQKDFNNIQFRDNQKKTALLEAGYEYIEISYKDKNKLSGPYLQEEIFKIWS